MGTTTEMVFLAQAGANVFFQNRISGIMGGEFCCCVVVAWTAHFILMANNRKAVPGGTAF